MGCRRQPRIPMTRPASLCGMDAKGRAFVDRVRVLNMSRDGALLEDVSCGVRVGDVVALRCDETTRRFRVIWDQPGDGEGRQVGLTAIGPVPAIAECWLPAAAPDDYVRPRVAPRRLHQRYDCEIAVEIRLRGEESPLWVTATDVSEGGCRVQVPHAMQADTEVNLALWLDGERVWMRGTVTHCVYGCGTGIRFRHLQESVQQRLNQVVASRVIKVPDRRECVAEEIPLRAAYCVTS